MSYFMNLHELPAGTHMFTAMVSGDEPGPDACYDELDFTAPATTTTAHLLELAAIEVARDYDDVPIVGIVDQSTGQWRHKAEGWR